MEPTIFAVSTGRPPAAIAIVRVSGPAAITAISSIAGTLPAPRRAGLRALRDAGGAILDRALVLVFPGPDSATGEDLVELHCHGGRAVVDAVERALATVPGLRAAAAGEFTRRALINGRIDLAEAEGLADLLGAQTERQRIAALSTVEGRVGTAVRGWLDRLAIVSARIEALLDFSDEDDVVAARETPSRIRSDLAMLAVDMDAVLAQPPVERLRDGIRVVLGGAPNSGKSTLINLLADRDVAIVSPIAGTTRDRIEASVTRAGLPFVLTDTAGLADRSDDAIERLGMARAANAIVAADIVVWLGDDAPPVADAIWVQARSDVPGRDSLPPGRTLAISSADAASIDRLWAVIVARGETLVPAADAVTLSRWQTDRCRSARDALRSLVDDPLILAEECRVARRLLGEILGLDATETLMDALFSRFCIGK